MTFYHSAVKYPPPARPEMSTTVFITTTMMSGETSRFTDDYGTLVPDVDHHGLFTFDQAALGAGPGKPKLTELALAARSSASFPAAFEPSYVPVGSVIDPAQGVPEHPDMAAFANMTRSHWAADGGLLANRPLTPLLAKVFAQPATGQVRRVLAFVVPDGGGTPRAKPEPVPDDDWDKPLTMAGALRADLGAQLSQSIASDLEATRAHNERINARHDLRRSLADLGSRLRDDPPPDGSPPSSDGLITGRMLRDFERQQGSGLAQPLLAELMRQLTTMEIPAGWAAELAPGEADRSGPAEPRMATMMVHALGCGWREQPAQPAADAAATMPPPVSEEAAAWAAWGGVAAYDRAARFGLPVFHAARTAAIQLIRLGYQQATTGDARVALAGHRKALEDTSAELPPGWADDGNQVRDYLKETASAGSAPDLMTVTGNLADRKRQALLIGDSADPALAHAWELLAVAVQSLLADLRSPAGPEIRASRAEAAEAIERVPAVLRRGDGAAATGGSAAQARARRTGPAARRRRARPAGRVRPVQRQHPHAAGAWERLAARDAATGLGDQAAGRGVPPLRRLLQELVAGLGLDVGTAGRQRVAGAHPARPAPHPRRGRKPARGFPGGAASDDLCRAAPEDRWPADGLDGDCLEKDLAFLDQHAADIPVSLPNSALFLAQAWQNLIAASELPAVADQMAADGGRLPPLTDPGLGHDSSQPLWTKAADAVRGMWHNAAIMRRRPQAAGPPDAWVTGVRSLENSNAAPAEFARTLPACPVRQETLAGELRTPAFARLAAKAAAVVTAAVAIAPEAPGAVRPVLASARTVTRTGYQATRVTGGSGWKTLLAGVLLVVIGVVLATQQMMVVGLTGTIIALVGAYLIALGAWGIHRGVLGALVAITALALPVLLTLSWVRTQLWGDGKDSTSGLVPRDVLPWLRTAWWGGLAVLGGIVLLAVLLSLIPRRRPPLNRATKRSTATAVDAAPRP